MKNLIFDFWPIPNRGLRFTCAIAVVLAVLRTSAMAIGINYEVNSTADGAQVGNLEVCNDGTGHCTLRAAIQASNNHAGVDGISFAIPTTDPNYNGTGWTIPVPRELPDITEGVNISGPGRSQLAVVRRSNIIPQPRIRLFRVTTTGVVSISGLRIEDGSLPGSDPDGGGGIQNAGSGTVSLSDCEISNCVAHNGGAIANTGGGNITLTDCWLHNNSADELGRTSNVTGGAIYNYNGSARIVRSTLSRNQTIPPGNAFGEGAGVYNKGALTITNSTIAENQNAPRTNAGQGGVGIGVYNDVGGTLVLTNSTIANNDDFTSTFIGGGVRNENPTAASAQVKNCLIAKNHLGDVAGQFTSFGFNLIGAADGSSAFNQATDQTGTITQPLDSRLDYDIFMNGGPVPTFALLFGSPAIDKGSSAALPGNTPLSTDQRGTGFARTVDNSAIANAVGGDGTDIGAFEYGAGIVPIAAASRKYHGTTGGAPAFDLPLPLSGGAAGVESRRNTFADTSGPNVGRDHELIVTLPNNVVVPPGTHQVIDRDSGNVLGNAEFISQSNGVTRLYLHSAFAGGRLTDSLALQINLRGVSDGTITSLVSVPMDVLLADANSDRSVNSGDATVTRNRSGQSLDQTNFRSDYNLDGFINSGDATIVRNRSGSFLP